VSRRKELARRRRNDKFRIRRKKRRQLLVSWSDYGFESREAFVREMDERATRTAEIGCVCSCHMCGNPRKHWLEKTKAEILFDLKFEEALKDVEG
jgi:hypothetical protein